MATWRRAMVILVLGGACALSLPAQDQANPPQARPLPRLDATTMSVPWTDFKHILEQLAELEAARKPKEAPKPPFEYAIVSAKYDGEARNESSVHIKAALDILVLKTDGWVEIPLIGGAVAPTSAMLDGEPMALSASNEDRYVLATDQPGPHTCELEFDVLCLAQEGRIAFEFAAPRSSLTQMTLRVPEEGSIVSSPMAARVETRRDGPGTVADLSFRIIPQNISIEWTPPAMLRAREAGEAPSDTRVTCTASTLATVTDRYLACESNLRYDVLRGSLDTFEIRLPQSANVLNVFGQGAAWSQLDEGDAHHITVKVNHRVEDTYELTISYEAPFEEGGASIAVPALLANGVVRQTGFVAVTARANVEVSPGAAIEGLTRIDTTELPVTLRSMSPNPLLLAYKYADGAYSLGLGVRKLDDVPVRVASIDEAALVTMITKEGKALTRALYAVRNNVKQYLRVGLNAEAEVWGAEVGGQMVKPARDNETGAVLIPLFKSVESNRQLGAFPVSLIYEQPAASLPRVAGSVNLAAPLTDIPVNEVSWDVLIPESQHVYRSRGDLEPLTEAPGLAAGAKTPALPTTRTRREQIFHLREGIERFFITDINNPAASARTSRGRSRVAEGTEDADVATDTDADRSDVSVAGILPVRMDLPIEGVSHRFRRLLAPNDKPLELTLYTYHTGLHRVARLALAAAGIAAGWAAAHGLRRKFSGGKPWPVSLVAGMAAGAALLALRIAVGIDTGTAFWLFVLVLVLLVVAPWVRALLSARMAPHPYPQPGE